MNDHPSLPFSPSMRGRLVVVAVAMLALGGCTSSPAEPRSDSIPTPSGEAVDVAADPVGSTAGGEGWIAFSADWRGHDLRLVRAGEPAHRILGGDDVARRCPAFEPRGERLAFGSANGNVDDGWTDAALGIALVSEDGEATVLKEFALDGFAAPPCPVWSPDGDAIAIGTQLPGYAWRGIMEAIVLVDTETGALRRIDDIAATDFEWSPDGTRLYIAAARGILAYSVADAELSVVDDTQLGLNITVSPDGENLAVERRKINAADRYELWLMGSDGSDAHVIAADYAQMHGLGPVWAPDGDHVVYQRSCVTATSSTGAERPCREEHEAVIVTVSDGDPTDPVGMVRLIAAPRIGDGSPWYPYSVTWSPDSSRLLYLGWWVEPDDQSYADGLIVVPLDGSEPTVLYESSSNGVDPYAGSPMNNYQSWAG